MRGYRIAVVAVVVALIISLTLLLVTVNQVVDGGSTELYVIDTPSRVQENSITAFTNESLTVTTYRCLRTNDPVLFEIDISWISEEGQSIDGGTRVFEQREAAGGAACEGSNDPPIESQVELPVGGLPPGTWMFVSTIEVLNAETGELLDRELNNSEMFEVVE